MTINEALAQARRDEGAYDESDLLDDDALYVELEVAR